MCGMLRRYKRYLSGRSVEALDDVVARASDTRPENGKLGGMQEMV